MSELESRCRPAALQSLRDAAWSHWMITESLQVGPAKFTRRDVLEAERLIHQDNLTLSYAEAMDLRAQWDALIQRLCLANGRDIAHGYDIAFSTYGERFALVQWGGLRRWRAAAA